jgi:hypothetical protein
MNNKTLPKYKKYIFSCYFLFVALFLWLLIRPIILWIPMYYNINFEKDIYHQKGLQQQRIYQLMKDYVFDPAQLMCFTADTCMPINKDRLYSDHDYNIPKPENAKRIILLGDSYAAGYGLKPEDTFWYQLENSFEQNIEVVNFGFPGSTSQEQVENFFHNNKGPKYDPDMMVLRFQCNDILPFTEKYGLDETYRIIKDHSVLWPRVIKNSFFKLGVHLIRNKFQKYYFRNKSKVIETDIVAPLKKLHKYTAANNVVVLVLGDYCEKDPDIDKSNYSEVYTTLLQLTQNFKWHWLDLCKTGINYSDENMHLKGDEHPSGLFNSLIAANVHKFMVENSIPGKYNSQSSRLILDYTGTFRVVDSLPRKGAINISTNQNKFIFFLSKPIDSDSFYRNLVNNIDLGRILGMTSLFINGNKLEIKMKCYDQYLNSNSSYSVKLEETIMSVDGHKLIPFELNFHTVENTGDAGESYLRKNGGEYPGLCK